MTSPTTPLAELEAPCRGCEHQNGIHTKGARRDGWPIYDRIWANALGGCNQPGCNCPRRT